MSETQCQFDLLQRITVPNGDGIVGVIVGRVESVESPPMYSLSWTSLNGRSQSAAFSQAECRLFNPPPRDVVSQPLDAAAFSDGIKELANMEATRRGVHTATKTKRALARKSKSKKRK